MALLFAFKHVTKHTNSIKTFHPTFPPTCRGSLKSIFTHHKSCQLQSRLTKPAFGKNQPTWKISLICAGSSLSFGVLLGSRSWSKIASCEYKAKKQPASRLLHKDKYETQESIFPWKEFLSLLRPDKWYLLVAVVSAFAVAIVNIQIPLILGEVVNVVSEFAREVEGDFLDRVREPATRLLMTYCLQGFLTFIYVSSLSAVGERLAARMRKGLFENIIQQDISFFDSHRTGEVINRLTSDVQDFKSSFKLVISQGLRSVTQVIGCAVSLFLISPKLTGLLIVVVPSIIGVGSLMGSLLRKFSRKAQAQVARATGIADEAVGNVRTVRAFAMEDKEIELYSNEVDRAAELNHQLGIGIGMFQGLSNIALNSIILGTIYVGGFMMSQHEVKAGDLMSFLVATQTVQRSLAQLSLLFGSVVRGICAGARVFEFTLMEPGMKNKSDIIPYHSLMGRVEFKNVCFSYPTRPEQSILNDFSLVIPEGKVIALAGLSGNGKSTIAALLERFYDVKSGSITIDGRDIRNLDPKWLRGRAIAYINQEPVLFATSVIENIRYGKPDATDQEVYEAAKAANAHDFIESFPDGYQTILGERGVTVSGGQKQRIAIARALIKKPSILILDEATSALDAESEKIVQETLNQVIKGHTVLVIAHRLSTIRDADVIAVINKGVITEMGSHEELKKKRGQYWNLIKQQEGGKLSMWNRMFGS